MSARKRPLFEIAQSHPHSAPARHTPTHTSTTTPHSHSRSHSQHHQKQQQHTPHYARALQTNTLSNLTTRSAHSARHTANSARRRKISLNTLRPDGSARNILRQFARLTAPVTKKRAATPPVNDKENLVSYHTEDADGDDDSIVVKRPKFAVGLDDDEDSELPVPPTPSVLPDEEDDGDGEEPTITFQRMQSAKTTARIDGGRKSGGSNRVGRDDEEGEDSGIQSDENEEGDVTIMTERGRRALSEDATGRFSRYSLGFEGFNMSAFGSEPEIRRESDQMTMTKPMYTTREGEPSLIIFDGDDDTTELHDGANELEAMRDGETLRIPALDDDTFRLPVPDVEDVEEYVQSRQARADAIGTHKPAEIEGDQQSEPQIEADSASTSTQNIDQQPSRAGLHRQSLLEAATATARKSRAKRQKLTQEGVLVPTFPSGLTKRIIMSSHAQLRKRPPKLGRDHLKALEQATEWFFEQVGEDLAAYSSHGKRKKRVSEDDILLLMRRQRVLKEPAALKSLARWWLPGELPKELQLPDKL